MDGMRHWPEQRPGLCTEHIVACEPVCLLAVGCTLTKMLQNRSDVAILADTSSDSPPVPDYGVINMTFVLRFVPFVLCLLVVLRFRCNLAQA